MRQLVRGGLTAFFILFFTGLIILYGRGYRIDLGKKTVATTGSLVATSDPNGAQVFIDNKFTTATNSTIQLPPGEYTVRIAKEGYIPWEKRLVIRGEVVTKADATLFPTNPSLSPLTSIGVKNPIVSPDGSRIVFVRDKVATTSARRPNEEPPEGLWILELTTRPLGFNRDPKQIARSTADRDWSQARLVWSPDGKKILASFEAEKKQKNKQLTSAYLLNVNRFNTSLADISKTLDTLLKRWGEEQVAKRKQQLLAFPKEIVSVITNSTRNIAFSPDETKILYQATASASLPIAITPPLLGTNPTPEERQLEPGKIYVYDAKEDKNFFIMESEVEVGTRLEEPGIPNSQFLTPISALPLQWYHNSRHLILLKEDQITMMDYDGTNQVTVYAGPFVDDFVAPWPSGGKLIILTTLNPTVSELPNLYLVNLR